MRELDEDTVRLGWMQASELSEEDTLAATKRFFAEQPELVDWIIPAEPSAFHEDLLQIVLMAWQIVLRRESGTIRPISAIDSALIERLTNKRQATIGAFLAGKQARAMSFLEGIDQVSGKVDFPQWALLGHLTEALADLLASGDWCREEAESAFVSLTALVDAFDRLVKS